MSAKCVSHVSVALLVVACCACSAFADTPRVVATGDSITTGYAPARLKWAFEADGRSVQTFAVATGGCASDRYVGESYDFETRGYRDYAAEVIGLDPDVIIFMLGTNDAFRQDRAAFPDYARRMTAVFDAFESATNSRGCHPLVIVSAVLPVLWDEVGSSACLADDRISTYYNPWLEWQADEHGFTFVDVNASIRMVEDWQELYSDGVHLWGEHGLGQGYTWLADQYESAVAQAVPEPISLWLMAMGAPICIGGLRRRPK